MVVLFVARGCCGGGAGGAGAGGVGVDLGCW